MKTYRTELEVRGYELDSYGHVNHAVYPSYLEHARWQMLESESINLKTFAEWPPPPSAVAQPVRVASEPPMTVAPRKRAH